MKKSKKKLKRIKIKTYYCFGDRILTFKRANKFQNEIEKRVMDIKVMEANIKTYYGRKYKLINTGDVDAYVC